MKYSSQRDVKDKAAETWRKEHGYKTLHEAYADKDFRKVFDRALGGSAKDRKRLGMKNTERTRIEERILRSIKQFGDTP